MYNFKINEITINDESFIIPKQVNVIIGPNSCGKSQFLKDIRNNLHSNHGNHEKSIVITKMKYELPKNKEDFIEKYNIEQRIFKSDNNQYYIRNYSGMSNFGINPYGSINISNYFDMGSMNIIENWKDELDRQIANFENRICHSEEILSRGNFSEKAIIHEETYVEDEQNGQIVRINISRSGGPLYSEVGESISRFIETYGDLFYNYLGTEEKLLMCKMQKRYGLQDNNTNFLSEVQYNNRILKELSNYTKRMFNKDIYLDKYTWGDKLLFRTGNDFDFIRNASREDSEVEKKLNDFIPIDNEGDGIKNFVTTFLTLNLNDKNILLLDEPETFLHPPLAKQLGEIIGQSANDCKQIFVSTHSVDLLKGILNSCDDVNIIRLTRNGDINNVTQLNKNEIKNIISNPLLSSSNILNGLFCEKVYICEAESDEEFYQVLHDKINLSDSCFFTHGKGKQDLYELAKVYDSFKVPNYRIYDFDLLIDDNFNRALHKFIPNGKKDRFILMRNAVNQISSDKEVYHRQGIRFIKDSNLLKDVDEMLLELKKNNIIILKNGCLETSLEDCGISFTTNKNKWFTDSITFVNSSSKDIIEGSYIYNWIYN